MARLVQAVRFFVGLTLVAAGVIAAGPYVATLVSAYRREMAVPPQSEPAALPGVAIVAPPLAPTMPAPAAEASRRAFPPADEPAPVPSAPFVPRADYRPPAPPGTLPPLPPDLARPTPAIAAAYRSTLDVPPPPLLDSDAPPPLAVGWTATGGGRTAGRTPASQPSAETSTYVVRDGDDLTAIAMKVYGHAGGAQAIWEVNRDHLADPNLLPIGLVLRIPPAWSVPAVRPEAASQRLIEPGQRPARVRVAPGETLESLAQRFYGDPALATRLYEVNRDRLRSPALLVPGMELRLP